jgi:hypothetical protein
VLNYSNVLSVYELTRIIANAETSAPLLDATTALLSWQHSRTWGHDGIMGWMNGRSFWVQPYDGFLSLRLGGVSADLCGLLEGTRATGIGQRHNVGFGYFAMYSKPILAAESGQAGAHLQYRQRIARYSNHLVSSGFWRNRGHEYGIRIEDLIEAHSVRD